MMASAQGLADLGQLVELILGRGVDIDQGAGGKCVRVLGVAADGAIPVIGGFAVVLEVPAPGAAVCARTGAASSEPRATSAPTWDMRI